MSIRDRNINKVGIVGFGTMGSEIAYICAECGYSVIAMDENSEAAHKGLSKIDAIFNKE